MTHKQAKSELMQIYGFLSEEKKKAIDVAVKALQEQDDPYQTDMDDAWQQANDKAKAMNELAKGLSKFIVPNRTQADGDLISKSKLVMYLNDWRFGVAPDETTPIKEQDKRLIIASTIYDFMKVVEELPSVAIPNKVGHWVEMGTNEDGTHNICCGVCGIGKLKSKGHANSEYTNSKYKFCINCGCPMEIER